MTAHLTGPSSTALIHASETTVRAAIARDATRAGIDPDDIVQEALA